MTRVLAVGAHPDDVEFGMGGTILALAKAGADISILVLTNGDAGSHGTVEDRRKEMQAAAEYLGAELHTLEMLDCHVEDNTENRKRIAAIIRKTKPDIIFSPHHTIVGDHHEGRAHPDHEACGKLVRAAARYARFSNLKGVHDEKHNAHRILYYMLSEGMNANVVFDVSNVMDAYEHLAGLHTSQLALREGSIKKLLIDFRKKVGKQHGVSYAESFFVERLLPTSAGDFLQQLSR